MKLRHYREKPMTQLRRARKRQHDKLDMKPEGLWVSVKGEDDWPSWCEIEDFRWPEGFAYTYEVALAKDANVLVIETVEQFDAFADEYADKLLASVSSKGVNWNRVAKKYDGIIIAPYRWDRRLGNHLWYYGWDCASGCIWNMDAVASIKQIVKEEENDEQAT